MSTLINHKGYCLLIFLSPGTDCFSLGIEIISEVVACIRLAAYGLNELVPTDGTRNPPTDEAKSVPTLEFAPSLI
jgi:hypothetical protein